MLFLFVPFSGWVAYWKERLGMSDVLVRLIILQVTTNIMLPIFFKMMFALLFGHVNVSRKPGNAGQRRGGCSLGFGVPACVSLAWDSDSL